MSKCPGCSANFVTPHSHPQSFDSGSRPEEIAKREVELGTGYITVTDHGTLEANRAVYDMCAPGGKFHGKLTPILGLEAYFRDDDCPIFQSAGIEKVDNSYKEYIKYMHLTMHFLDQESFLTSVKLLSDADLRAEKHGSERKPLFNWENLELLGSKNTIFCSSCLIGMVGRHLLANNDHAMAEKYYDRVRSLVKPGNFYVEMFPHKCDRNYVEEVIITFEDDTQLRLPLQKNIATCASEKIKVEILGKDFEKDPVFARQKHSKILAVMKNRRMEPVQYPPIKDARIFIGELINECRPWAPDSDVQLGVNKFILEMANKYGDKILISDDSHFATKEEKIVQDVRLAQGGSWRFTNSHHRLNNEEAWDYFHNVMHIPAAQFQEWVENSREWASRFKDFKFDQKPVLPTKFYPTNTLEHTIKLIEEQKRMDWNNPEMTDRFKKEIDLLHRNGTIDLLPYFFIDQEVTDRYLRNGHLTGPGRGSAAGLLLSYLLGITHVNPLKYGLSLDRFITLDRIQSGKLPDIDQDLPDRDLLVDPNNENGGWLKDRFGDCVAQISTDGTLKLKNAMRDVARMKLGAVPPDIHALAAAIPDPPQGISDRDFLFGYEGTEGHVQGLAETDAKLKEYIKNYPDHWDIVQKCCGLARQKGRHACAFAFSNEPIGTIVPLTTVSDVRVTQFTKDSVEAAGLLKMDFLVVKALGDINRAIRSIQDKYSQDIDWSKAREKDQKEIPFMDINGAQVPYVRCVPLNGVFYDIWDLPKDKDVFNMISESKTDSVFQIGTPGAKQWLRHFNKEKAGSKGEKAIASIEDLSAFTALDRPGPLDAYVKTVDGTEHNMLVEFAKRSAGEFGTKRLKILDDLLPETYGVIVYQEQLTRIFQEIGGTTGIQAQAFRQHIGKKQMEKVLKDRDLFMKGAKEKLGEESAQQLWAMMETFGQYGFNKSHSVCYMVIAYATAWLKFHYPLEWWCAVLNGSDRNKINEKLWSYCGKLIAFPDIKRSTNHFYVDGDMIRAPLWLLMGVGDKAQEQISQLGEYNSILEFVEKIDEWKTENPKIDKKGTMKKGRSAITDKVAKALILSGSMDSLFQEMEIDGQKFPKSPREKLQEYARAQSIVTKKKFKADNSLEDMDELDVYLIKKKILPHYSEFLFNLSYKLPKVKERVHKGQGLIFVKLPKLGNIKSKDDYVLGTGPLLRGLMDSGVLSRVNYDNPFRYCLFGYVIEDKRLKYKDKKTNKEVERLVLTLEADGDIFEAIMWPKDFGLHPNVGTNLKGSIICAGLVFRNPQKPEFENLIVIKTPIEDVKEEEEEEEEESK